MINKSVICGESEEALKYRADRMREFFQDLEAQGKEPYAEYDTDHFDFVGRQLGTGQYELKFKKAKEVDKTKKKGKKTKSSETDSVSDQVTDFCNMRKEFLDRGEDEENCSPLSDLHMNIVYFQPDGSVMADDFSKKGRVWEDIAYRGYFMQACLETTNEFSVEELDQKIDQL